MILCIDVGNTQIYGGVFDGEHLKLEFRKISQSRVSADEFGLFLNEILNINGVCPKDIRHIALCSVVPEATYSLRRACLKYFGIDSFVIKAGIKTGLKIKYRNPLEVGADRIANAIGAVHLYPDRNMIIVDFGTATTFCVINRDKAYLGGVIMPGVRISLEALVSSAAKLASVEIEAVDRVVGRTTAESMQSGLYYGQIGMVREITRRISEEEFRGRRPLVIGTGGFSTLFEPTGLFDVVSKELVLKGLYLALMMNQGDGSSAK